MEKIRIYYDSHGNTLNVWFSDPRKECVCEETGEEVVLVKNRAGKVIGFEKLNFSIPQSDSLRVAVETVPT